MSKKIKPIISYPSCHRCLVSCAENPQYGIVKCDSCIRYFCAKCIVIHNKHQECFCEFNTTCYICGEMGFYDYPLRKPICGGHI